MINTKNRAEQILITDPVVTRLWLLILFFSTPLHCYYEKNLPNIPEKRRKPIMEIQNSYLTLLWKYLSYRHGDMEAVRIFSNINGIYLRMQRISQAVNTRIRTQQNLLTLHETFNRAVAVNNSHKKQ